jgi:CheY-like chemotaxis protein
MHLRDIRMSTAPAIVPCRARTRVVLAEDDFEMRSLVARALRDDGATVEEVTTGRELLERVLAALAATATMPDVIVSDIRMPGGSGLDVLRELRRRGCEIPVVLLTGFADDALHEEVRSFSHACLFDKPFDLDDLVGAVLPQVSSST